MSAVLEKNIVLPEGWVEPQLSALSERITKGSTPTSYGYAYKTEGIKFIKAENIDSTGHASTTSSYIDDETHEFLTRSQLKENDLLFSIAGTIGRVGIVRGIDLPANTNQALAIIRLANNELDVKYLYYYLNSPQIQSVALKNIVGVGRANLSLTNIGEFRVPLAPSEQQKRIVAKIEELFSHIDAGIEALKKAKQLLKQYRQSVLKAAVTGELTKDLPCRQAGWRDTSFRNISGKRVPEKCDAYFSYVLECEDGSLYKGFTKDLFSRINVHLEGRGAKWTKEHKPVSLIHFEEFSTEKEAVECERYFKSGSGREWLNDLRNQQNKKYEPAFQLLERIFKERRQKWEEQQLEQFKTKGKIPKDDKWKEKYKGPEDVKDLPFYIPDSWITISLDTLLFNIEAGKSFKCDERPPLEGETGIVKVSAVTWGEFDSEESKTITDKEKINPNYRIKVGDFLFRVPDRGSANPTPLGGEDDMLNV